MLDSKQYKIEFGFSMALYIVSVLVSASFLAYNQESSWRIWISLLPVLPAILGTTVVIKHLKKLDELQQRIQMTSFAVSFAIVGITTFTYGFLENVGFPHIPYLFIFPFMIVTWGLASAIVTRSFK